MSLLSIDRQCAITTDTENHGVELADSLKVQSVYPNPTSESLDLVLGGGMDMAIGGVSVVGVLGRSRRVGYSAQFSAERLLLSVELEPLALTSGLYAVRIEFADGLITTGPFVFQSARWPGRHYRTV